jgi:hypothetical protein
MAIARLESHNEREGAAMELPPPNPLLPPDAIPKADSLTPPPSNPYGSFMGRMVPTGNLASLSGYYFAIFSLIPIVGIVLGPFAIIMGLLGFSRAVAQPQTRGLGHALFAIATGILTTILNWTVAIMFLIFWWLKEGMPAQQ